ncbi:hypothetical protein [Brucella abortus]|uniref:hypothetical protein n=1 Tax=Brucella abortus TaxID=235 RepID=UPI00344D3BEF
MSGVAGRFKLPVFLSGKSSFNGRCAILAWFLPAALSCLNFRAEPPLQKHMHQQAERALTQDLVFALILVTR